MGRRPRWLGFRPNGPAAPETIARAVERTARGLEPRVVDLRTGACRSTSGVTSTSASDASCKGLTMSEEARVLQLLEEALQSGRTLEEVCADAPELFETVRAGLEK